ncbi:hypothetical protein HYC85_016312 [Camellia sinensis]|uniref:Uncharacterized protein n=1 Tax=Camellia sinensis TaxID=4442 RepID=A0A7J7H2N2_CAMSI|nr:hypothetical protein HYC85_016312 [Camellia sinensis]
MGVRSSGEVHARAGSLVVRPSAKAPEFAIERKYDITSTFAGLKGPLERFSEGREFMVEGKTNAWKTPSSEFESLNLWAQNSRFLIGNSLDNSIIHLHFHS